MLLSVVHKFDVMVGELRCKAKQIGGAGCQRGTNEFHGWPTSLYIGEGNNSEYFYHGHPDIPRNS